MRLHLTLLSTGIVFALAALLLAVALTFVPREAQAGPAFTKQTGKPCAYCHTRPPELNARGKQFKENGNKF